MKEVLRINAPWIEQQLHILLRESINEGVEWFDSNGETFNFSEEFIDELKKFDRWCSSLNKNRSVVAYKSTYRNWSTNLTFIKAIQKATELSLNKENFNIGIYPESSHSPGCFEVERLISQGLYSLDWWEKSALNLHKDKLWIVQWECDNDNAT